MQRHWRVVQIQQLISMWIVFNIRNWRCHRFDYCYCCYQQPSYSTQNCVNTGWLSVLNAMRVKEKLKWNNVKMYINMYVCSPMELAVNLEIDRSIVRSMAQSRTQKCSKWRRKPDTVLTSIWVYSPQLWSIIYDFQIPANTQNKIYYRICCALVCWHHRFGPKSDQMSISLGIRILVQFSSFISSAFLSALSLIPFVYLLHMCVCVCIYVSNMFTNKKFNGDFVKFNWKMLYFFEREKKNDEKYTS